MELADAYEKEQNILEKLKEYKYVPKRTFDGRTECLKENPQLKTQLLIEARIYELDKLEITNFISIKNQESQ